MSVDVRQSGGGGGGGGGVEDARNLTYEQLFRRVFVQLYARCPTCDGGNGAGDNGDKKNELCTRRDCEGNALEAARVATELTLAPTLPSLCPTTTATLRLAVKRVPSDSDAVSLLVARCATVAETRAAITGVTGFAAHEQQLFLDAERSKPLPGSDDSLLLALGVDEQTTLFVHCERAANAMQTSAAAAAAAAATTTATTTATPADATTATTASGASSSSPMPTAPGVATRVVAGAAQESWVMVRRGVAQDSSSLFNSVGYLLERQRDHGAEVRTAVASMVLSNPANYSAALLGRPIETYPEYIMQQSSRGGPTELSILAQCYQAEFAVFDVRTMLMEVYGEASGYTARALLLFDGNYYAAVACAASEHAPEANDVLFVAPDDDMAIAKALMVVEEAAMLMAAMA